MMMVKILQSFRLKTYAGFFSVIILLDESQIELVGSN